MTDHGKCSTCGREMQPASRYGGLCWECEDAEGKWKDATIAELRSMLKSGMALMKELHDRESKMVAEIRVLRAAVKVLLGDPEHAIAKAECLCGWMHLDNDGKAIIRRIFDEN